MIRRLPIVLALLFSLCVSRGEGVHIFPFADAIDAPNAASLLAKGKVSVYGLSIIPQDSHFTQKLTEIDRENADSALAGNCILNRSASVFADSGVMCFAALAPQRTKFLLTSGSDRSPPLFS